jgi:plastocyanin
MKKLQKSIIPSNQYPLEPAKLEVDPGFEVTRTWKIRETAIN